MEPLDRLVWADGLTFSAYGVRVGVRVSAAEMLDQLMPRLPPGWRPRVSPVVDRLYSLIVGGPGPRPGMRRLHLLYGDTIQLARTRALTSVFETLEADVQRYVVSHARRRCFVHAGVIGWQGRAIVIPGRSFSGKTTLVAEWIRAGARYYSDEYAAFDARGRVHPYPKPLSLREHGTAPATLYPVAALGGRAGVTPLPVGLVLVSTYQPGARWRPRRLSPGQGSLALLAHALGARQQPEATLTVLRQVALSAPVLQGVRGEASEVVHRLIARVGDWHEATWS